MDRQETRVGTLSRRALLAAPLAAIRRRPNIVFVLVDDLRFDELGCTGHPFAQTPHIDRLAREGVLFRNAFAATPLCSPSRATFLTGLYPHQHGIVDNTDRSSASHQLDTWPRRLHDQAGYQTAFIGKWHMGNDDSPRPGFDHWVSFPGQGESVDPPMNINGRAVRERGYITDVLTRHAVDFIRRPRAAAKPFCLYLAHKAIHPNIQQAADGSIQSFGKAEEFIVAERHRGLYANADLPRRGNYARPPVDKPALQRALPGVAPLGPATATDDATIRNRARMTKAIDEGVGDLLGALEAVGQLDDTVFVFTSDHGYFYGEHGLNQERRLAYEEAIRIPLIVRYPRGGARVPRTVIDLVSSVDVAPTLLDFAGLAPRGSSLAKWTHDGAKGATRGAVHIEYHSDRVFPRIRDMGYRAVRTVRWKHIHYLHLKDADELYDLAADPYELRNLIRSHPKEAAQLRALLLKSALP
ncbi:MAG: sulfatase-like hydrolase/transferase [Bryobacterales bacterium]|nr:sulfatase-like hydrolase/transferase [Bryobacterales bacterium]